MKKKTLSIIISLLALITFLFIIRQINISTSSIELSKRFQADETTGIMKGAEPLYIKGQGGTIIFFHGLSSSPQELKTMAANIHDKTGYTVYVPLIAGHGTTLTRFSRVSSKDFLHDADAAYEKVSQDLGPEDKFYIVGQSSGAVLASYLASQHDFDGVIMYSPSFLLLPSDMKYLPIIQYLYPVIPFLKKEKIGDIEDPQALKERVAYPFFSTNALLQFLEMVDEVRPLLSDVTEPLLIFMSKNDHSISMDNPDLVISAVASTDKKVVWVERSGHVISVDYDKETIMEQTVEFMKSH